MLESRLLESYADKKYIIILEFSMKDCYLSLGTSHLISYSIFIVDRGGTYVLQFKGTLRQDGYRIRTSYPRSNPSGQQVDVFTYFNVNDTSMLYCLMYLFVFYPLLGKNPQTPVFRTLSNVNSLRAILSRVHCFFHLQRK